MKNKFSVKKIIFLLSLVVSMLVTVSVIGKPFTSPFPFYTQISDIADAYITDDGRMAVIDQTNRRILLTNTLNQVTDSIYLDRNSFIDTASIITGDRNYWYVYGVKYIRNTTTVSSDCIVRYDKNGKHPTLIYSRQRNESQNFLYVSSIESYGDSIIATVLYSDSKLVNLDDKYNTAAFAINKYGASDQEPVLIATDPTSNTFSSFYCPKSDAFYDTNIFGTASICHNNEIEVLKNYPESIILFLMPYDDEHLFVCDDYRYQVFLNDTVILDNISVVRLSRNSSGMVFCADNSDEIITYNVRTGTITRTDRLEYSFFYSLKLIISLLLPAYLGIVLIWFGIRGFRRMSKASRSRVLLITGALSIVAIIIAFYNTRVNLYNLEDSMMDVSRQCEFLASTYADNPSFITDFNESNAKQKYNYTNKFISNYIDTSKKNNIDYVVFLSQKKGDSYYQLYDSLFYSQVGSKVDAAPLTELADSGEPRIVHKSRIETILCARRIYDTSGKEVGILEIGQNLSTLKSHSLERSIKTTLEIISLLGAVYLILFESTAFFQGLNKKRDASLRNEPHPELYNIRSISFLTRLVITIDSVLLVLITRDMLSAGAYPKESITMLTALPATLAGVGLTVGSILYTMLAGRITVRKLCTAGSIFMTISYVVITYSVITNNFVLFCIFKFTGSIANNVIYGVVSSMPNQTDDETRRYEAFQDSGMGGLSSGILGALLGGYLADQIGNASLYILSVIILIFIVFFLYGILPKNTYYVSNRTKGSNTFKQYFSFFLSPVMIAYILFLAIPFQTIYGYKNFLFPIYSSALELPKIYVSSFVVIAKLITLLMAQGIRKISIKFDYWNVVVTGMLSLGFFFLGFILNSTIVWAIFVLIIASILEKAMEPAKSMLTPRMAKAKGMDVAATGNVLYIIEQFAASTKEIIISFFLLFGNNNACMIMGIFMIVCTALFALITRKSPMAQKEIN